MAAYGIVITCSTREVSSRTRANVPGFNSASAFGASASKANVRVSVVTAGLMRDTVAVNVLSGKASTRSVNGCPTFTHGAMRSGISERSFNGSTRTTVMTGICAFTSSPRETIRCWM